MTHGAPVSAPAVHVELIGPFGLSVDGVRVDVSRRQVRAVISRLALDAGKAVSGDTLAEMLWPSDLPADPRAALRVVMSRVRSALGARSEALTSTPGSYRLEATTDVAILLCALERANAAPLGSAERLDALRAAQAQWRGAPIPELNDTPAATALDHFTDSMLQATAELGAGLLEAGAAQEAIATVADRATSHPEHEILAQTLARAQAELGHQASALASIQRTQRARRTLGLEPAASLAAVELEILRGGLDRRDAAAPAIASTVDSPFVGREAELENLTALGPGTTIVVGEPGIGKTSLLDAAMARLDSERQLLHLVADRHPTRPLDVSRALARELADHGALDAATDLGQRLAWLLTDDPNDAGSREQMVDDLVTATESLGHDTMLVIDDVQWADRASISVVEQLVANATIRVVLGSRPHFDRALRRIAELDGVTTLALEPLSIAAATALVAELGVRGSKDRIESIARRSGGNPLLTTMLADLAIEGELSDDAPPSSVLMVVRQRVDDFSAAERDAIDVASVLGEQFDMTALDALRPNGSATCAAAAYAGLLVITGGTTVRFRHPVVREALLTLIPAGHVVELHDEIASALVEHMEPADHAYHCVGAAELDAARAASATTIAAEWFAAGLDWGQALHFVEMSLRFDAAASDDISTRLRLVRGRAMRALAQPGAAIHLREAAEHALERDDIDVASAALEELCRHGEEGQVGLVDADLFDLVLDVLDRPNIPARRWVRLAAAVPTLVALTSQADQARSLFARALETATSIDEKLEGDVMLLADFGLGHPDDFAARKRVRDRLTEISGDDLDLRWEAAFLSFGIAVIEADRAALDRAWSDLQTIGPDVPGRRRDFGMAFLAASYSIATGELDAAAEHTDRAFDIGSQHLDPSWVWAIYANLLSAITIQRDGLATLAPIIDEMISRSPEFVSWRAMATASAHAAGNAERAEQELRLTLERGLVPDATWTALMVLLTPAIVDLADGDTRRRFYEDLLHHGGRMSWTGVTTVGPVDSALAQLAESLGDEAAARQHQRNAAALSRQLVDG